MSGLSDHRPVLAVLELELDGFDDTVSRPSTSVCHGRRDPRRGSAGLREGRRERTAGRWSTGSAAACRPASSTPATTCPRTCWIEAYDMLAEFFLEPTEVKREFVAPGSHGQTGYTGLLVETAASSDVPDWKEMLNWGREAPRRPPAARRLPAPLRRPGAARGRGARHHRRAQPLPRHASPTCSGGSCASSPSPSGATRTSSTRMLRHGPHLTRAIHYPAMDLAPARATCGPASTATST